ncbi:beta-glucosidase A [Penicillium macrosclerotiorum]|uniref:beta-glucosidase A n=1 Tax=Penicillium macrosclerotiorum TaxID=303699 RepID=UPI00254952EF|nr:beta-glucosidase A [Penicillium macrosclerotiorum]KAJ5692142.1 beta-glucosidase A [Penicillium macrosclerotiorum]
MLASTIALALAACVEQALAMQPVPEKPTTFGPQVEEWFSEPFYPSPWMNPRAKGWEEAYQKAHDFVSQLNLLEKVNLTTGVGWMNGPCVGNTGSIPRLGFKGFCTQDSPQGVRFADYASAFTSSQMAAATFDRSILYQRGQAMAREHKGKGVTVQLGPVSGPLGRTPEGGRNWEGFSPDPVLSGIAMAETIKGIQDTGVIASAKHYIGNEQEHFRQVGESAGHGYIISDALSSNIDDRTFHELYLWPFADAVRAGVGSVLCSYTQINNSYGCQNSQTLNKHLKSELGFQGFVVSDWQAHHSGVSSALAGLDMSMPGDTVFDTGLSFWGSNLTIAVLNGTVPEWRLDDMAMRIMAAYFKVGNTIENQPDVNFNSWTYDTNGFKYVYSKEEYGQVNWHVNVQGNHSKHIRETAAKGTVLLKNNFNALPLKDPKFVAVVGEDAGPNRKGPNGCGDRGCDEGTLAMGWGSGSTQFPYLVTPDSAIQSRVLEYGGRYESVLDNWDSDAISALVSQPDATCLVFGNADSGEAFITVDDNWGDRNNITLWQNADEVIRSVSSICSNTIVVLHTVGPVLLDEMYEHPNITAIVWAGMPGQESGNALVDILWGEVNPAGRSPFTWAKERNDYGTDILSELNNGHRAPQQEFTEGVYVDYRHFDKAEITPIYEFGYGLSYTTFSYSDLRVVKKHVHSYQPTVGTTTRALSFKPPSKDLSTYQFPSAWKYIRTFIYPYLNDTTSLRVASKDPEYGRVDFIPPHALDSAPQPLNLAGDRTAMGGNEMLYDVLYEITAKITNTGDVAGDEVPQLYVDLGGDNPPRQLRDFARLTLKPGQSAIFKGTLTRRDLSNWDTTVQNWVVSDSEKKVYVGSSSRRLPLTATLE